MDRILVNNDFFDAIAPTSFFEQDFEDRITANADFIFSGWLVVPFKCKVFARELGEPRKKPDLALVHPQFREWWVLEVELGHHSLAEHVIPQVSVFAFGSYESAHADHICKHLPSHDRDAITALVTTTQPGVLVIVNEEVLGWRHALASYGVKLCTVKPYRNVRGQSCYLISGDIPSSQSSLLTRCQRADGLPRALILRNPASLRRENGAVVEIDSPFGKTSWCFHQLGGSSYLFANGRYPFSIEIKSLELHQDQNGTLRFVPIGRRVSWNSK